MTEFGFGAYTAAVPERDKARQAVGLIRLCLSAQK